MCWCLFVHPCVRRCLSIYLSVCLPVSVSFGLSVGLSGICFGTNHHIGCPASTSFSRTNLSAGLGISSCAWGAPAVDLSSDISSPWGDSPKGRGGRWALAIPLGPCRISLQQCFALCCLWAQTNDLSVCYLSHLFRETSSFGALSSHTEGALSQRSLGFDGSGSSGLDFLLSVCCAVDI